MNFEIGSFGRFEYYVTRKVGGEVFKYPHVIYGTIIDKDAKYLLVQDNAEPGKEYIPERKKITKFEIINQ